MKLIALAALAATLCNAQITVPEGTRLRVRLQHTISSATAEEGQPVELTVAELVAIGSTTVIGEGARVTGTITQAQEKRRMGRAGKLDFSIDRVKGIDNQWIPLRYTVMKKAGGSNALRTGIITAGVAFAFLPAAPVMLLMKGKDSVVNKGTTFEVFTDTNYVLTAGTSTPHTSAANAALALSSAEPTVGNTSGAASGSATVTITSTVAGADIEVDGAFAGSTPTALQLSSGQHKVVVKGNNTTWERTLQVTAGSNVSLNATVK